MNDVVFDLGQAEQELSRLVGHEVEVRRRLLSTGAPCFVVFPKKRELLKSGFWAAVLASQVGGIWDTLEEALVGFAAGAHKWAADAIAEPPSGFQQHLQERLAAGPQLAALIYMEFERQGVSRYRLDRAARRLGVVRRKAGMGGGWVWRLPKDV